MATDKIIKGISFDRDVFEALEKIRGNAQRTRSPFVNNCVREKLGLKK